MRMMMVEVVGCFSNIACIMMVMMGVMMRSALSFRVSKEDVPACEEHKETKHNCKSVLFYHFVSILYVRLAYSSLILTNNKLVN